MSQVDMVVNELKRSFEGEAWHGPALLEILDGIDAQTAAARPLPKAHSIWELVLHIAAWEDVVRRRIHGETCTLTDQENFGQMERVSDSAWRQAVENLRDQHARLLLTVSTLPESRLNDRVPGKDYPLLFMLWGTVQHAAYHGGQIALLKRASS
jgi:uncharacterized damage-inducible protein DinB